MRYYQYVCFLPLFLWSILVGCREDESESLTYCSGVVCTSELRSVTVSVVNSQEEPVALDRFFILNLANHHPYYFPNPAHDLTIENDGFYSVMSDKYIEEIDSEGTPLLLIGFKDDEVVIREQYDVGRDCCHVYLISDAPIIRLSSDGSEPVMSEFHRTRRQNPASYDRMWNYQKFE
uniref:Lipoprotein n=1 Tax=Roseihalotalea indica TaxID=2867963 RepID=A0AA49JIY6_9BACT|nr:hypothetical protein K4G66_02160 [Tunicatimonas sp. TK19036]